ncbi:hypothetical protein [Lactimicrobium massiliense]|uniref:hypothetical protein n=1 Tax=Lactimicrobium massiliense TaxID=2161814 RepID=UPI000D555109|nr:hypothetical protein [Lactimicrobium massiliense]MDY3930811.1 hypothetical protein [Erysipelotrichaceae bacterium]
MGKICRPLYTPVMILIQMIVPLAVFLWFKNHIALPSIPIRFSGMGNYDATKKAVKEYCSSQPVICSA